jgi:PKD repeat protein
VKFVSKSTPKFAKHSWSFGDGTTSVLKNPVHTYAATGLYNVCLAIFDSIQNCTDTFCMNVQIDTSNMPPPPALCHAKFVYHYDSSCNCLQFVNMSSPMLTTYLWDFGDNTTSALKHPSHTYTSPGTYIVTLTASGGSSNGIACVSTYTDTIVWPAIPIFTLGVSEENTSISLVQVYPNPVTERATITITASSQAQATIRIFNSAGQAVSQWKETLMSGPNTVEFNTSGFRTGIYTMQVITENGTIQAIRFLK